MQLTSQIEVFRQDIVGLPFYLKAVASTYSDYDGYYLVQKVTYGSMTLIDHSGDTLEITIGMVLGENPRYTLSHSK